uniref:Kisspeptin n=1 Tax=Ophionotus victoriae TaxID=667017 RepID=A0A220W0J2_9ECHI|nr:kisspeptin precursor [Ophionotus victoriae]
MRSWCMLRLLPLALICAVGLPVPCSGDRSAKKDIPLLREEELQNSPDYGLESANIFIDVIERILDRLESSAAPPYDNDINISPETSWPPLENDFLSREHIYLPKPSTNGLILSLTSFQKRQGSTACMNVMCRMIRGRPRVNANAGSRALPFGKRADNVRNSADDGPRSVRGRRRGRGRPRTRGSPNGHPQQHKLPFGKRHLL